ncbi:MAG: prolipoprotein diacylglyceryl transferase [Bacilli bacterium]|nr:prolipoprotein diacylglyceryl transferase [Bacilli bacterium]
MLPTIGFIDSYVLFLVLGIVAALVLFEYYFRKVLKEKESNIFYLEMTLIAAITIGILGAYLVQNLYDFIQDPSSYHWEWKLTFFGGALFGVGGFIGLYMLFAYKKYKEGLYNIFIIFPACIALAHAFGRIGCFMEGCCYGLESDAWYAIYFPSLGKTVIPTQLFEMIFLFLLAGVLTYLAFKKRNHITLVVYAIGYGVWRFLIEFLRDDPRGQFIPGLTPSQFWAILLAVFGIGYLIFMIVRKKKTPPATEEKEN